jgi:type IV secretion system protein VirD4
MDGHKCILQLRGLRPFLSPKYDLKKHPNYKYTAEADKRNIFDTARFISTKLEVKPDDVYTVYHVDAPVDSSVSEDNVNEDIDMDMDILNFDDMDDPDVYA